MTAEVDEIGPLLARARAEVEAQNDARLERLAKRSGWGYAALVAMGSAVVWAFTLGVAYAEVATKKDLAADVVANTAALDRFRDALQTHSERITSLETEMRVRNANVEAAPLAAKGKKP